MPTLQTVPFAAPALPFDNLRAKASSEAALSEEGGLGTRSLLQRITPTCPPGGLPSISVSRAGREGVFWPRACSGSDQFQQLVGSSLPSSPRASFLGLQTFPLIAFTATLLALD